MQLLASDHGDADQDVAGDAHREDGRVENAEYHLTDGRGRSLVWAGARAGHRICTRRAVGGLPFLLSTVFPILSNAAVPFPRPNFFLGSISCGDLTYEL